MDEFDASNLAIKNTWRTLAQLIETGKTGLELSNCLKDLLDYSDKSGIPSTQIDWIIAVLNTLTNYGDDSNLCVKVLYLLIPNEPLTDSQIDGLIKWFLLSYENNSIASKYFTFWLLVCLKAKIISKDYLQTAYYHTLCSLLLSSPKDDGLSLVLRNLAKPFQVTELDFTRLYDYYKSSPNKKDIVVLIRKYAEMRPDIAKKLKIPKLIQPRSLKITDNIMNRSFETILALHDTSTSLNEIWMGQDECFESSFFNITPMYGQEDGINITSLSLLDDLIKYYDSMKVPDNIISILEYTCGQHYVAFSSLNFTEQLEEQVAAILGGFLNNHFHPGVDYLGFLKALARTQATCNQGMPRVSTFLSDYLIIWDGLKFRDAIIDLIPWFCFNSFRELEIFMKRLFNVYVSMPLESKIKVVEALGDLYVNLSISYQTKTPIPFIGSHPSSILNNIYGLSESLTFYIKSFICMGLLTHGVEPSFLSHVLILYYKVFIMEQKLNFRIFTLMPEVVILLSQTSSCITVLCLLCKMITLYLRHMNEINHDDSEASNLIIDHCRDTTNILLYGMEKNKLESLFLRRLFSIEDAVYFGDEFDQIKNFMSVPKHFAFTAIVQKIAQKFKVNIKSLNTQNYLDILDHIAPDCASLIKECATIMDIT